MQCPHCGAEVMAGNRFCGQCRKRVAAPTGGFDGSASTPAAPAPFAPQASASPASAPQGPAYGYAEPRGGMPMAPAPAVEIRRTGLITAIAVLDLLGGAVFLIGGLASFFSGLRGGSDAGLSMVLGVVYLLVSGLSFLVGTGLLQLKDWARTLRIVLACLGLLGIPCGTLISILVLVYLLKPGVKVLFSGKAPSELTPQEAHEVAKVTQGSSAQALVIAIVAVILGIVLFLILAAIAIPSLLRARIAANEADVLGDLRAIVSGEAMYQSASMQGYGTLDCLVKPESCIPYYKGPAFLDPAIQQEVKHGYRRTFKLDPGGRGYEVVAVPVDFGTGTRSFCTNESSIICQSRSPGEFSDGTCDTRHCTPL